MAEACVFEYEGKTYRVEDPRFGHSFNRVVLPDKQVLQINHWLEGTPRQPLSCDKVLHKFQDLSQEEIAKKIWWCSVAVEV